jgi:molybdenum cofactor cytidylyltransferase
MQICQALRCKSGIQLAAVGAGGKSSILFSLARQIPGKVIITTTTHLAMNQARLGDLHITDNTPGLAQVIETSAENAIVVLTSEHQQRERVSGPSLTVLNFIHQLCKDKGYSLLIEADGSRKLPLKAPGEDEPVIPDWVDEVLVLVGCSGFGKPLNDHTVFHPEIFSGLSGLPLEQPINLAAIIAMLIHPLGGRKNIPSVCRSLVVFNQADQLNPDKFYELENTLSLLTQTYDGAAIASIQDENSQIGQIISQQERKAGIILAAGESQRYGQPKQLLQYNGKTFLRHTVQRALESGFSTVMVVLGYQIELMRQEIEDLPVTILENKSWQQGQSTSVKTAVEELLNQPLVGGAMFFTVDQPLLRVATIKQLMDEHNRYPGESIVPICQGKSGSPVLIDSDHFSLLMHVTGDKGGRAILTQIAHHYVEITQADELMDIDTPQQYQQLIGTL